MHFSRGKRCAFMAQMHLGGNAIIVVFHITETNILTLESSLDIHNECESTFGRNVAHFLRAEDRRSSEHKVEHKRFHLT